MGTPLRIGVALGVVAAVVGVTGAVMWPGRTEQRHQDFRDGLQRSLLESYNSAHPDRGAHDAAWVRAHAAATLAYAQVACEWLGTLPDAPEVDPTEVFGYGTVMRQFDRSHRDVAPAGLSRAGAKQVRVEAWAMLCRDELDQKTAPERLGDD